MTIVGIENVQGKKALGSSVLGDIGTPSTKRSLTIHIEKIKKKDILFYPVISFQEFILNQQLNKIHMNNDIKLYIKNFFREENPLKVILTIGVPKGM